MEVTVATLVAWLFICLAFILTMNMKTMSRWWRQLKRNLMERWWHKCLLNNSDDNVKTTTTTTTVGAKQEEEQEDGEEEDGQHRPRLPPGRVGIWGLSDETLRFIKISKSKSKEKENEAEGEEAKGVIHDYIRNGVDWIEAKKGKLGRGGSKCCVFVAQLFLRPTIVSVDPSFNRFVLLNEGRLFRASYPSSVLSIFGPSSLLSLHGPAHHRMRSFALSFSSSRTSSHSSSSFLHTLHVHAHRTLSAWLQSGPLVLAYKHVRQFTFNVMVAEMMSLSPEDPDTSFFLEHYQNFMQGLLSFRINLPGTAYRRALTSRKRILKRLNEIMAFRRSAYRADPGTDTAKLQESTTLRRETASMMRWCGAETESAGANTVNGETDNEATGFCEEYRDSCENVNEVDSADAVAQDRDMDATRKERSGYRSASTILKKKNDFLQYIIDEGSLKEDQVLDLIMNLLFAGFETTSVALTLCIAFLAQSPAVQHRLREEHQAIRSNKLKPSKVDHIITSPASTDSIHGNENFRVSLEDYKAMEYTQYVIKETLRMGTMVRFVHREAIEEVNYREYRIPKGWQVLPIFIGPHLDQDLYNKPFNFKPERWQTMENVPYFTPFGAGIRLCTGIEFAKLEMAIFLHHLVLNYEWSLAANVEVGSSFPFVEFPNGLPIKIKNLNLY